MKRVILSLALLASTAGAQTVIVRGDVRTDIRADMQQRIDEIVNRATAVAAAATSATVIGVDRMRAREIRDEVLGLRHQLTALPNFRPDLDGLIEHRLDSILKAVEGPDPADGDFKHAREVLNGGNYRRAADLFDALVKKYPASPLAPDALYWQAYAIYRNAMEKGKMSELGMATRALRRRIDYYPNRTPIADAEPLMRRIQAASPYASSMTVRSELDCRGFAFCNLGQGGETGFPIRIVSGNPGRITSDPVCETSYDDPRSAAVGALANLDPDAALVAYRELLNIRGSCSESIRSRAARGLPALRVSGALPLLLTTATSDPSAIVRTAAIDGIQSIPTREALRALDTLLWSSEPYTKQVVLSALLARRDVEVDSILRRFAADERMPGDLRQKASAGRRTRSASINYSGERQLFRELENKAKSSADKARYREAYQNPLGAEAEVLLVEYIADASRETGERAPALSYLLRRRPPSQILSGLYDRLEGQPTLQAGILDEFGAARDSVGIEKLIQVVKTGGNSIVARRAMSLLAKTRDPRAAQILLDLVKNPSDVKKND